MPVKRSTAFDRQVRSIAFAGVNIKHEHKFDAILHTPTTAPFYIQFAISLDISRNYTGKIGDETVMQCQLPLGDFVHHIYPNRDSLEMTIVFTTVGLKYPLKYIAIITNVAKEVKNGNYANTPLEDLNKEDYTPVTFQLKNKTVEGFRGSVASGGIYKKMPVQMILSAEMFLATGRFSFFGGLSSSGVEIAFADNWKIYKQVVIPADTHSKDIPVFLQAEYGVYKEGITTYIQNYNGDDILFIYPPYRTGQHFFKRTLNIYLANNIEVGALNNTYTVTDSDINILGVIFGTKGTGELKRSLTDFTTAAVNAIKAGNTEAMATRPVEVSPKAIKAKSSAHSTDQGVPGTQAGDNAQYEAGGRTANLFALWSKVEQDKGRVLHMQWTFSNARYLTPGMAVIVNVRTEEGIEKFNGTLHGVYIAYENNRKIEVSQLAIFFKKDSGIFDLIGKIF